ncbi:fatty acid desaturase family protein [Actinomadura opuntiae]|uniref:fatty acid desaturase family protein n=1 Tax=Actinomadura sp. OS1-43 TaxID=604315 RepID=UPI00255B174C|nr:fatty acid desaturase [Actinomadura sp. OS1-43]MDL4820252.1 fatty acid desaturase [Actinomadura sp. OS1-43]
MNTPPLELSAVRPSWIVDDAGIRYTAFRRTLAPRWDAVWGRMLGGHLAVACCGAVIALLEGTVHGTALPALIADAVLAVTGGAVLGFWLHYLLLFLHEAAHYNLAPSRRLNDLLANACLGAILGSDVRAYRKVHFAHHRNLGTTADTETSYFAPLDRRFLTESLTGVRLVRSLAGYQKTAAGDGPGRDETSRETAGPPFLGVVFVAAGLVNGTIVVGALLLGLPVLAASWALGMLAFLPLFNSVRQVLEHRGETADDAVDYRRTPHGAVNRLFGDGMLAATLGGAGFNRHLLHHWDPSVSFTRLREMEGFLLRTDAAPLLLRRRTTYAKAWRELNRI